MVLFTGGIKSIPEMRILERFNMKALRGLGEETGVEVPPNVKRLSEQDNLCYTQRL